MRHRDCLDVLPALIGTAAIDKAITAAVTEGAELLIEASLLKAEMIRLEEVIAAHNAIKDTPQGRAEHARIQAERDEIERRCRDLITGAIRPVEKRLAALNSLRGRASVRRPPPFIRRRQNGRK